MKRIFLNITHGFILFLFTSTTILAQSSWISGGKEILYADPLSVHVGIGLVRPEYNLDVNGIINSSDYYQNGIKTGMWLFNNQKPASIYFNSGKVGIGTDSPNSTLSIDGEIDISGNRFFVGTNGKIGVGTNNPFTRFQVRGIGGNDEIMRITDYDEESELRIYGTGGVTKLQSWYYSGQVENGYQAGTLILNPSGGNIGIGTNNPVSTLQVNGGEEIFRLQGGFAQLSFRLKDNSNVELQAYDDTPEPYNLIFNPSGGNVGIGTNSPRSKLAVNGTITAKEIVVTENGWSDFVFEEGYRLPPLEEVEQYIKKNKHLPNIPSVAEVAANGVSLGKMQAKLLQKIEELTLYMIELKKENEVLRHQLSALKLRIEHRKTY